MIKIFFPFKASPAANGMARSKKNRPTRRGFSLIELLGVLAVMGILAAVTVPPIIRQIQQARTANEDANLEEVARAIVEGIKAGGTIPNPNIAPFNAGGWADVAVQHTTLTDNSAGPGTLQYVFPLDPAFAATERRVYLDPALLNYLDSFFGGVGGPFSTPSQGWPNVTVGGVAFPNQSLKMYIVSSSRPDFVLACPVNGPGIQFAGNSYGNISGAPLISQLAGWVKAVNPATGFIAAPGSAVESWANNGHQFLHVKVVDLRPLFCKVLLTDTAAPENTGGFGISTTGGGYPANSTISLNYGNNRISFFSDSSGSLPLGQIAVFNQIADYNSRHPAVPNTSIPGGMAQYAVPASPSPPTFDLISTSGPGAGKFAAGQTLTIYIIKGRSINLFNGANVLDKAVVIQTDEQHKYLNNSWTRVD